MQNLLKKNLKNSLVSSKKIALLGVGSELRGDDAAGILIVESFKKGFRKKRGVEIKTFIGGTAPENLTGEIKRFSPDCLLIIDSADFGKKAGAVSVLDPNNIAGISFSTHILPLKMLTDYMEKSIGCRTAIIGIQPKTLEFGKKPSAEVRKAVKLVSSTIRDVIKEI